jgi:hypothetical protein
VHRSHGSNQVSNYLRDNLHSLVENADAKDVARVVSAYKAFGGYLKRFKGGILQDLADGRGDGQLSFAQRTFLAFLQASFYIAGFLFTSTRADSGSIQADEAVSNNQEIPKLLSVLFASLSAKLMAMQSRISRNHRNASFFVSTSVSFLRCPVSTTHNCARGRHLCLAVLLRFWALLTPDHATSPRLVAILFSFPLLAIDHPKQSRESSLIDFAR